MLSRPDLEAAVFIGGMEGVEIEYEMFTHYHPHARVIPVAATGGAALQLAMRLYGDRTITDDIDFAKMFQLTAA
jgi:SLOG cluster3 family